MKVLSVVALVVITILVYWNGVYGSFVWDDHLLIEDNPAVMSGEPLELFKTAFFSANNTEEPSYYRPVTTLTYWLDHKVWRVNPFGYHLTNILLNVLCTLLVYLLFIGYIKLPSRGWAWFGAALFALHPYHTESVSFISGRTDILATIFVLASFMLYISHRRDGRALPLYLSVVAFALGILSKEVAFALLPAILVWELLLNRKKDSYRGAAISYLPFLVLTAAYFPIRFLIFAKAGAEAFGGTAATSGIGVRLFYSIYFLAKYIYMLVLPIGFNAYRAVRFYNIHIGYREVVSFVIVGGFIGLFVALLRKRRFSEAFWGLFIICGLLPVLNIIRIPGASAAERFLYLPSIGFSALLAIGMQALDKMVRRRFPRSSAVGIICMAILFFYGSSTIIRNYAWSNDLLVYRDLIRNDSKSVIGHANLATLYLKMGDFDSTVVHARIALSRNEGFSWAWLTMGKAYGRMGRYDSADYAFRKALTNTNEPAKVYYAKASMDYGCGRVAEAEEALEKALELNDKYFWSYFLMAKIASDEGSYEKALEYLGKAKALAPDKPLIYKLYSEIYVALGENEKALDAWGEYMRLPGIKLGTFTGEVDSTSSGTR